MNFHSNRYILKDSLQYSNLTRFLLCFLDDRYGFCSGKISIGHCQNESAAEQLKALILAKFKNVQIEIHKFRGLCSFYAEKGGVLIGFEKA